jgi:hypothetical protein
MISQAELAQEMSRFRLVLLGLLWFSLRGSHPGSISSARYGRALRHSAGDQDTDARWKETLRVALSSQV